MNPLLQRISVDPNVCFGKPCIRGTRIWVSLILDFLASGMSVEEIIGEYTYLTEEDIRACMAYGAEMSRERYADSEAKPDWAKLTAEQFLAGYSEHDAAYDQL